MMMSNHVNLYSQHGCIGCKPCEGGAANVGRLWTLIGIAVITSCIGLIFLPFYKRCQYCGHNMWWNKHYGPDMRQTAQAPVTSQQPRQE